VIGARAVDDESDVPADSGHLGYAWTDARAGFPVRTDVVR